MLWKAETDNASIESRIRRERTDDPIAGRRHEIKLATEPGSASEVRAVEEVSRRSPAQRDRGNVLQTLSGAAWPH